MSEFPVLTDGVVTLSQLLPHEIEEHIAGEDSEIVRWINDGTPSTLESTTAWVERNIDSWRTNGPIRSFEIRDATTGALAGNIEANWSLDWLQPGEANIAWYTFAPWRGRGYVTRAVILVMRYLRSLPSMHTAIAPVHPDNAASLATAQRLGFSPYYEGEDEIGKFIDHRFPLAAFDVVDRINSTEAHGATKLVAIAGRGGSGKTTLATAVRGLDPSIHVVHLDDIYKPHCTHEAVDGIAWSVVRSLLDDLRAGRSGSFRELNWDTNELGDEVTVEPGGIVLFEGVPLIHPTEIDNRFDVEVWVECVEDDATERGIARDGEWSRPLWERWVESQRRYVAEQRPIERAHLVIDTNAGERR